MTAALVGAIALGWGDGPRTRAAAVGGLALIALKMPILLLPICLIAVLALAVARFRQERQRREDSTAQLAAICDVVSIGLTGGLGIHAALTVATTAVEGEVSQEVAGVLRRAHVEGLAAAMTEATGVGNRLYRVVGRAASTGSPLLGAVSRLADELQAEMATVRLQAAKRLPVALLFPLTLLILPGFLLLTVAPAIVEAFARLEI